MENLNLINLPSLVVENIVDHLTSQELQQLRATCTTFQSYIKTPTYMKKIKIHIKVNEQLSEIRESQVPLCNVFLYSNVPYSAILAQDFKSTIVELKLQKPMTAVDLVVVLNNLSKLESLDFLMDSSSDRFDEELEQYQSLYFYNTKKYNNLKKLKIEGPCSKTIRKTFVVFFNRCPKLISIELPRLSLSSHFFCVSPKNLLLAREASAINRNGGGNCDSLLKFIHQRTQQEPTKQLTIDFGKVGSPNLSRWRIDCNFNFSAFPLTPKELLQLAKNAKQLKLLNVPSHSLPRSIELSQEDKANLDICVLSIVDLYLKTEVGRYRPPRAEITVGTDEPETCQPYSGIIASIFQDLYNK